MTNGDDGKTFSDNALDRTARPSPQGEASDSMRIVDPAQTLSAIDASTMASIATGAEIRRIAGLKSTTADEAPKAIGPYTIIRELGRGGQGIVFLAHDPRLNRRVALKVLSASTLLGTDPLTRFRREAAAAARLDHPGICPVFEIGFENGAHYIAMRHIEGESLSKKLNTAKKESGKTTSRASVTGASPKDDIARIVSIVERAARALHAAHEEGIIHRDVKPANLMITPEEDVVVMDFGLAHDVESIGESLTRTGDVFGTPLYMAPEQLQASIGTVDRRIDVYALGVTLYEALTLRPPFNAQTRQALFHQILEEEPIDPRRLNPGVSRDLAVIIMTAMEKSPTRRYRTAQALADDLLRLRRLEPILARPAGPIIRLARWAQRHPGVAVLSAGIIVGLSGGLIQLSVKNSELESTYEKVVVEQKEKEAARAKERLRSQEIRTLANDVLFGVSDAISELPGATRARAFIVEKGLRSIEGLSKDAEADPSLRRDLANAYLRVGNILGNPTVTNLGRIEEALPKIEQAKRIYDELLIETPNDPSLLESAARARYSIAQILFDQARVDEPLAACRESLALLDKVIEHRPESVGALILKAYIQKTIGAHHIRQGRRDEGIADITEALATAETAHRIDDGGFRSSECMIALLTEIARSKAEDQKTAEAIALFERASSLAQSLPISESSESQADLRTRVGISSGLGRALLSAQRLDESLAAFRKAHELAQLRAARDPANFQAKTDSAVMKARISDVLARSNRPEEAAASYQEAFRQWEVLVAEQPKSRIARHGLLQTASGIGDMFAVLSKDDLALEYHQKTTTIAAALFADDPDSAVAARDLVVAHMKIGEDHIALAKRATTDKSEIEHWRNAALAFETAQKLIDEHELMKRVGGVDQGMRRYVLAQIEAARRAAEDVEN